MNELHPDLLFLLGRVIEIAPFDLTIPKHGGKRTEETQRKLFESGASKTLKSRHLHGLAVDVVPYVHGTVSFHWPHYDIMAEAFYQASRQCGVHLEWGAAWGRKLTAFDSAAAAKLDYIEECHRANRDPYLDGAHFQLGEDTHPSGLYA